MKITALGPLHIGAGEKIGKKEYIFDPKAKNLYFPHMPTMIGKLKARGRLEDFEHFIMSPPSNLYEFLKKCSFGIEPWFGSPVSMEGVADDNFNEINSFIKDPYNLPYVPGSSVKGAFRTVMLFAEARERLAAGESFTRGLNPKDKGSLKHRAGEIEAKMLNTLHRNENASNATNDIMTAFRFSDSEPISRNALTICRKIDLSTHGKFRALPTFRECLKPGTEINLTVSVDESLLPATQAGKVGIVGMPARLAHFPASFFSALDDFNKVYYNEFREMFSQVPHNPDTFFVGGGSGFLTKTMILGLFNDERWVKFRWCVEFVG